MAQVLSSKHHIPWVLSSGCCSVEIQNAGLATYDWQRLGVDEIAESPNQADLMIVAGWINEERAEEIKAAYSIMRKPTSVIAVGSCVLSGSPYTPTGSMLGKVIKASDLIPVDVNVPGCPPRPEALLDAVLELQRKLNPGPKAEKVLHGAFKHR